MGLTDHTSEYASGLLTVGQNPTGFLDTDPCSAPLVLTSFFGGNMQGSVIDFMPRAGISAEFTPLNTGRKRMLRMTSFGITVMNILVLIGMELFALSNKCLEQPFC